MYYMAGPDPRTQRGNFEQVKVAGPGHARPCPAVDILKATQQGAAPYGSDGEYVGSTIWDVHWRHLAKDMK